MVVVVFLQHGVFLEWLERMSDPLPQRQGILEPGGSSW
jgi:hypothetical protein